MLTSTPATIKYTVGVPGSGKSYTRVRWIVEEFLINEEGILYTNLPLHIDTFVEYFEAKGFCGDAIRERLFIIPSDVLRRWKTKDPKTGMPPANPDFVPLADDVFDDDLDYEEMQYEFLGPWTYFQNKDMSGAHILFDEIQEIVHTQSARNLRTLWNNWLSTIRHENCTIEFMTQLDQRVPTELKGIAETKLEIRPNKSHRFPMLPILNYDYYQLFKGLFDVDLNSSSVYEYTTGKGGKKELLGKPKKYRFEPRFFKFYDTSNRTTSRKKSLRKKEPWEQYSKFSLCLWFVRRNYACCFLITAYALGLFFMLDGGMYKMLSWYSTMSSKNKIEFLAEKEGLTVEEYKTKEMLKSIKKELRADFNKILMSEMGRLKKGEGAVVNGVIVPPEPEKTEFYTLSFIPSSNSYAILKNGDEIKIGSVLRDGKFKGKCIARISFKERSVFLQTGERLGFE